MKVLAGCALLLVAFAGAGETTRPAVFFEEEARIYYTGYTAIDKVGSIPYRVCITIGTVNRSGKNHSCNSGMHYQFTDNTTVDDPILLRFACDTLNFYAHAANRAEITIAEVEKGNAKLAGDSLIYPLGMSVGDTLPDAWAEVKRTTQGGTQTIRYTYTGRKVQSLDTLQLACGKVPAYRITLTEARKLNSLNNYAGKRGGSLTNVITEWFSPVLGVVKMEESNKDSQTEIVLESYSK